MNGSINHVHTRSCLYDSNFRKFQWLVCGLVGAIDRYLAGSHEWFNHQNCPHEGDLCI